MASILPTDNISREEKQASIPGISIDVLQQGHSKKGNLGICDSFQKKTQSDLERECLAFMLERSFPIEAIIADGIWHRTSVDGGKDEDEWYIAEAGTSINGNEWLMCTFGTWAGGLRTLGTYKSWRIDENIDSIEKNDLEKKWVERDQLNKHLHLEEEKQRIQKAKNIWEQASEEPTDQIGHLGYLSRKKIGRYGVRFSYAKFNDGDAKNPQWNSHPTLLIPLTNISGDIQAIQHIRVDGQKRIYGLKKGHFHVIGSLQCDSCAFYVAEGYATSATIHEATGFPVVVAFDCGNLEPVIKAIQQRYPQAQVSLAGDDDVETQDNPGRMKAEAEAKRYGGKAFFPSFPKDFLLPPNEKGERKRPTDWNDLHVHFGIEEVQRQLEMLRNPPPRLATLTYQELINKNIPDRKHILKPWLPEASISMVYAPTGVGKSYLCLSTAKVIASGGRLFDWEAPKSRKVLYLDGEMHESDLQSRIKKLLSDYPIPEKHLFYMNGCWLPNFFLPDLSNTEGQKLIEEVIDYHGIEVVFLDNLSTLCRTGKENETDSWKQMQNWLLRLRWKGITVVLVHHAGKTKDASGKPIQRGTSMREVALESSIVLDHPRNYSEEQGCVFELRYAKARGFWGKDAEPLMIELTEREGRFHWKHQPLAIKNYDRVVELYADGVTNALEIGKELGISRQAVQKHINRARRDGDIR